MVIFNEEKVKYEALNLLIEDIFSDIRFSKQVNVIVDLKEVFKKVFRPDVFPENIQSPGRLTEEITSDILGIISHYRNYFYKHGKYSSFYFLYSSYECENLKKIFPDYKKDHYEKYYHDPSILKIKSKVIKVLSNFIPYIPNCSYIDCSKFDDVAVVKTLKNKIAENQFTLLLTNDLFWFQALNPVNMFALNCKGIKSKLIRGNNAIKEATTIEKPKFSSNLLPLVLAIQGNKNYSLPKIRGIGPIRAYEIVNFLLKNGKIQDIEYLSFPLQYEILDSSHRYEKVLKDNFEELKKNYEIVSCTDLIYANETEIMQYFNTPKKVITANQLMDINAKLFPNFPINLDMLLRGETL